MTTTTVVPNGNRGPVCLTRGFPENLLPLEAVRKRRSKVLLAA